MTKEYGNVEKLLTVKQAAEWLVCSEAAIRKWLYQRRLRPVKIGRLVRLRQRDLEAMVTTGLRQAQPGIS
jgi:excisionase family DNA binding protein